MQQLFCEQIERKFVVSYIKESASIIEVECQKILSTFDRDNEYRAKIMSPKSLLEKNKNGDLESPIYYSFAFFDSTEAALIEIEKNIKISFERDFLKKNISFTTQDILDYLAKVNIFYL